MSFRIRVAALGLAPLFAVVFAAAAPSAQDNYKKHCNVCHGADGKSQTRLGRKSGAKDLSDSAAMAKLSDRDVFMVIKDGRKNAKGEEKMEPFGDDLSELEITDLVAYVRTLAK
jgi:mono/diheme cytochrome c family protein